MKNETADGKTSTSKIGGGSATSIVTGDYNENRQNNLLNACNNGRTKGEQNSSGNNNNNPYRSNFLNRNERLKLQ